MLIYVHYWFLSWLKLDSSLLVGLLNVEAKDSALIGTMVGNIVKLVVFLPFKFFSEGVTWFAGNLNYFFSNNKSNILLAFITSKS
jgi:hypothetical protein